MQARVDSARRKESALVVGLDPIPSRLPEGLRDLPQARAVREFCRGVLEAVEPYAAAVKLQAAYFERLGPPGMEVYGDLIADAGALGLPAIADVKRGDIGPVAAAYAAAHLAVYGAACVTVNPFMGADAVVPFLEEARRLDGGEGVFVLVATSNPSAESVQGVTDPPLFEVAARLSRSSGAGVATTRTPGLWLGPPARRLGDGCGSCSPKPFSWSRATGSRGARPPAYARCSGADARGSSSTAAGE